MSKEKREVVSCLKCGQQLFNTAGYCKCGEKLPYAPIQDVEVVTLCSNCRKIEVYKNGMFVGGTYTICPICDNGKLTTLADLEDWNNMSQSTKNECINFIPVESLNKNKMSARDSAPWDKNYYDNACPYCGKETVRRAKWDDKKLSAAFWGIWSNKLHANYKCDSCGKMWQ